MMDRQVKDKWEHIEELMATVQPMSGYKDTFISHCKEHGPRIGTGILELDKALNGGFVNELYIMGAETSTGKSAFLMFVAQEVARAGTDVLYFALEMGRDEFVARGISMISFEQHKKEEHGKKITAANVLYWTYDTAINEFSKMNYSEYEEYTEEYFSRYGSHLHIIEGGLSGLTVNDIANVSSMFKKRTGKKVAVFVDYLQIIRANPNNYSQADRKTKTDVTVTTLKTLASQIGMPVVTISSISRNNYQEKVGMASFKESGDTEYTGGIMIGWNWAGVTDQKDALKIKAEKKDCKERGYRRMTFDVLKYRNSERDSSVHLKYYPAYNFFEVDDGWDPVNEKDTPFDCPDKKIIKVPIKHKNGSYKKSGH